MRLCWFGFKADLKARYLCHLLAENYQCKKMCDRCEAIQPTTSAAHPMTYKNFSNDAPYTSTCRDHSAYLRSAKRVTPWAQVEGFQFEHISYDVMHLIFLGVARNHVPSALKLLKVLGYHYEEGESDDKFLQRASMEMKQDCKDHKLLSKLLSWYTPSFSLVATPNENHWEWCLIKCSHPVCFKGAMV